MTKRRGKLQEDATLLDILIDGFEWAENKILEGDPIGPIHDWIAEESGPT